MAAGSTDIKEEGSQAKCDQARLENISFLLVRPVFLGNIGATARLMKNFSLSQLLLVNPPRNYKDAEARKMAVGAFDILKSAKVFAQLKTAVSDQHLVIGTTSGQQRSLHPEVFQAVVEKAIQASMSHKVVFVFGDERNGLTNDELSECHHITCIPTDPSFPALNVAQAACVVAYELSRSRVDPNSMKARGASLGGNWQDVHDLAPAGEEEELFKILADLIDLVEFSRTYNRELVLKELRRFYHKGRPSMRELLLLKGVVHRLNQKLREQGPDKSEK